MPSSNFPGPTGPEGRHGPRLRDEDPAQGRHGRARADRPRARRAGRPRGGRPHVDRQDVLLLPGPRQPLPHHGVPAGG